MNEVGVLYTSYFSRSTHAVGIRIAVCRRLPAWAVKGEHYDEWCLDLAPSGEILDDYKDKLIDEEEYRKLYLAELKVNPKGLLYLQGLLKEGKDVTLLCWEAPYDKHGNRQYCHRNTLRGVFVHNRFLAIEESTAKLNYMECKTLANFLYNTDIEVMGCSTSTLEQVQTVLDYAKLKVVYEEQEDIIKITKMKKVCLFVGGSRDFLDYTLLETTLDKLISEKGWNSKYYEFEMIDGDAPGADTLSKTYAGYHHYNHEGFPADWKNLDVTPCVIKRNRRNEEYNALAGFIRNETMAKRATHMVLFHKNNSPGTADDIRLAKKYNIELTYIKC